MGKLKAQTPRPPKTNSDYQKTYAESLAKDPEKRARVNARRRALYAAKKLEKQKSSEISNRPLPPALFAPVTRLLEEASASCVELELITEPTAWTFKDGTPALQYIPGFYSPSEVQIANEAIQSIDDPKLIPMKMQAKKGVMKRHGDDGRALNLSLWYEQGNPQKGLMASSESVPRTITGRKAFGKFLEVLSAGRSSIFNKVNDLVKRVVPPSTYTRACQIVDQAILSCGHGTADHLARWGSRPFSSVTIIFDSPTLPHKDQMDHDSIPSVCARFGYPQAQDGSQLNDEFILIEHGLRLRYNPGDVVIGWMQVIEHQVDFSDIEGTRYSMVHSLRTDVVTNAERSS